MDSSIELRNAVTRLYESMGTADMAAVDRSFSREDGALAIGTDPSEWWAGHGAIIRGFDAQFSQSGARRVVLGELSTFVDGTVGRLRIGAQSGLQMQGVDDSRDLCLPQGGRRVEDRADARLARSS